MTVPVTTLKVIMVEGLEEIKRRKLKEMMNKSSKKVKIEVNDNNFQEKVIKRSEDIPVLVDFWAPWCEPCKVLSPKLEEIAEDYNGKFVLAKLNTSKNKRVASKYGIRSIPDVKLFKNGEVVAEFLGALPAKRIRTWLDKEL